MIAPELVTMTILAFLVGIVSSMIGVGGGFIIVPLLTFIYGFTMHNAVGTSLVMIVFTAFSSTFAYLRQKRIDYMLGLVLAAGSIPSAFIGAQATSLVSGKNLSSLFGVFLIILAARMFLGSNQSRTKTGPRTWGWTRRITDSKGEKSAFEASMVPGLVLSSLGGSTSGFFGVGGGAVMVPVMVLAMGVPMHVAVATSMFLMIFTSIAGAYTHVLLGNVSVDSAVALGIGIVFGTQVGAVTARKLKAKMLQRVFAIFLSAIGLRMALQYFF